MKIKELFEKKEKTFSFEIFPPKTPEGDIKLIHETLKELSLLKPDFVSCTYGAAGGNKDKTLALVEHIQKAYDIPSMAHLTCISHTKDEIHEIVKKIKAKGIQNILALRGDPPRDNPDMVPGIDNYKHSSELITFLRQEYKEDFCLGVAGFPEMHPLSPTRESDIKYLKHKIDCGADFIITQLFFDNQIYFDYVKSVKSAGIIKRIIPGILPITSYDGLIKFCKTCGATVPEKVHKIFAPIKDNPEQIVKAGIEFAINQCKELLSNGAPGIHFYSLNKVQPLKDIINSVR
ncbi:methylenetetrahydrofolate reductase [NAD(P)H] [Candidatus Ruminimicrobiellum ovillum]|uniref:methylenetetrahydrofolate reductase [NAD(P)H] n=1 Tax=Candidatus Ruminimicrobiellum ovillum TaxID=1947927 RepID=UPI00355A4E92